MEDFPENSIAENLYRQGMSYNWRDMPADAALSRAAFENSALLGHTKAIRELADMTFYGSGGPKDQERALWLKWLAFRKNDEDALEELSAMLASYSESAADAATQKRAKNAAMKAEEAKENLAYVSSFVLNLKLHGGGQRQQS